MGREAPETLGSGVLLPEGELIRKNGTATAYGKFLELSTRIAAMNQGWEDKVE